MIYFDLGVDDLADTRFAISPVADTVCSLCVLRDPGRYALHLPWRRDVLDRLGAVDTRLLMSLVGRSGALPDFLTPRPPDFALTIDEELDVIRRTPPDLVRRDLFATHRPDPPPEVLAESLTGGDRAVGRLRGALCDLLRHYWELAIEPYWSQIRLLLEADMTYRARRLARGGARLLFADLHPNVSWRDGTLRIDKMIGHHRVAAAGRGLLLVPTLFAYKPVPPLDPTEPPWLAYPCRGVATLWAAPPAADGTALAALLGPPRATLLRLLAEELPTVELARRLRVTPSAVSQHLRVLHATGLVTRSRDGRRVLYRRSPLGDQLVGQAVGHPGAP
ncbi:metalloregulator ArsR/SmtB family transcription factor [Plantactinospora sp. GCM10030261]|uniref:ArsR/SmtB family transcription factor n=1 Tax=Plantactinospora sp. GCM10030261 TaxID=3273420 RepID=UPI00360AE462